MDIRNTLKDIFRAIELFGAMVIIAIMAIMSVAA